MISGISAASASQWQLVNTSNLAKVSVDPNLLRQAANVPFDNPPATVSDSVYANVVVNGKTVATVNNSGTLSVPTPAISSQIQNRPSVQNNTLTGPDAAQARAAAIAQALGGTVVEAQTAQTQQQWLGSDYAKVVQTNKQWLAAGGATTASSGLLSSETAGWLTQATQQTDASLSASAAAK
jgi:hypothetical protein